MAGSLFPAAFVACLRTHCSREVDAGDEREEDNSSEVVELLLLLHVRGVVCLEPRENEERDSDDPNEQKTIRHVGLVRRHIPAESVEDIETHTVCHGVLFCRGERWMHFRSELATIQIEHKQMEPATPPQPPEMIELTRTDESVKIVLPFLHTPSQTDCDFCGVARSQRYKVDISSGTPRELRVCASSKCDAMFQESLQRFYVAENRVPLQLVESAVPSFLDPKRTWKVVRGTGDVEDGWKVARNWRVAPDMGALQHLRGEPWWRIPLQKDDKVRLALLDELRMHNSSALAEDTWEMLLTGVLPNQGEEPNDTFLENYPARVWRMPCPGDAKLLELRI